MTFTEEQMEYLETRAAIHEIVLAALEAERNGRDDIIVNADEATTKIIEVTGVPNPFQES